jgi:hypothetical protein
MPVLNFILLKNGKRLSYIYIYIYIYRERERGVYSIGRWSNVDHSSRGAWYRMKIIITTGCGVIN